MSVRIAFLGDIALIGKYNLLENKFAKQRLKQLAEKLKNYDYIVGNLESPLTDKKNTIICKSMHLKSPCINIELLKYLGVNAVSLANNHIYDYEKSGFLDTIEALEDNSIEWFGANKKYLSKEINGEKISLSGFCCYSTNGVNYRENNKKNGVNLLSFSNIKEQLEKDKKNKCFSIMNFHWGDEHTNYPKIEHIKLSERLVNLKDMVIVGHHPHIIQGIQEYKNSIVAYSLGNFLFDDCESINGSFKLKQNENNKKSFIFGVAIEDNKIKERLYEGFKDKNNGIEFFDINEEIKNISKKLKNIINVEEYNNLRKNQIEEVRKEKFGKHDIEWLRSRLNYYSIGAKIASILINKKYLKEIKGWGKER